MVSIIDNSLCESKLSDKVMPADITEYIKSLHEFGAAYVEMVTDVFIELPPGFDVSKVILRISDKEDLLYVNSFDFAYVTVPAHLMHLADKINRPIIAEIHLHGSSPKNVIDMFIKTFDFKKIAMIRLVDCFDSSPAVMGKLVHELRRRYVWPIDFCPLNNRLNAVASAITAVATKAESITLRFGSFEQYGELQDYTISLSSLFGVLPSPQMIMALYKCSVLYMSIFGRPWKSASHIIRPTQKTAMYVINIDKDLPNSKKEKEMIMRLHNLEASVENKNSIDTLHKKLVELFDDDPQAAQEMLEAVRNYNPPLYNIKKK